MRRLRFGALLSLVAASWIVQLSTRAQAKVVNVIPSTQHSLLTMTTDDSYGFQVYSGKPLNLDLVGPGSLTVTVRLNSKNKRSVLSGRFEMKRGRRRIMKKALKLHRSRVGAYKETAGLHPSLPKVFRIKVPGGLHSYTFSIRAPKGVSMTLHLSYDTEADQGKAHRQDDVLALVPLVPPTPETEDDGGQLALVPLVPVAPAEEKTKIAKAETKKPAAETATQPARKEKRPVEKKAGHETKVAIVTVKPKPPVTPKPEKKPPAVKIVKVTPPEPVHTIVTKPPQPPVIEKPSRGPSAPVVSLGLKFGQISPFQKVGGTTYTGSLDVRYILPVWDGRLTIGVEGGFYQYKMSVNNANRDISLMVIPIALQVFYRLPIHAIIEPYVGLGGDVFVCMGEDKSSNGDFTYFSGTKFVFGGHLTAGLEAEVGPGFILAEVRAGISFGDPGAWDNNPSISGLLAVAGYRFVF
ncbi:MAG TPA: hypothetical protein VM425_11770 [Myxococcota bacterium]|nr:hypothetical protein [Myxococcota bacterium]